MNGLHRNLNAARKRPDIFIWVVCEPKNAAGTFTVSSAGRKVREIHPADGAVILRGQVDKITRGVGRGESCFVYADTHTPCPISGLTIYADSTGMYII